MTAKPHSPNSKEALEQLQKEAETVLYPLGYEVVALEPNPSSGKGARTYTLYIDFLNNSAETRRISLADCIAANKAVDELFENTALLEGHYTLEVSSPGVERPLKKAEDYARFCGRKIRLHTFRPLDSQELSNEAYWKTHSKQKNFSGNLEGLSAEGTKVRITVEKEHITVPLKLISKAHLEFTPPTEHEANAATPVEWDEPADS